MNSLPNADGAAVACPKCGTSTTGRFCAECGTAVTGARCAGCRTELTPGAKFCHRCGLPAGAPAPSSEAFGRNTLIPWSIAGISLLGFIAFVAGQRMKSSPTDAAPPAVAGGGTVPDGPLAGARAPDISNMSPEEKRMRLYDKVMTYVERGMGDSLAFWAPMAIMAYQNLGPLDLDGQYDLGRLGEVSGDADLAKAQADIVLKEEPNHLLGLILAAHAAAMRKDTAAERDFYKRFLAAEPAEKAKGRPEYVEHIKDITGGEKDARRVIPPT